MVITVYCKIIVVKEQRCIQPLHVKPEHNTIATLDNIVNVKHVVLKGKRSIQNLLVNQVRKMLT